MRLAGYAGRATDGWAGTITKVGRKLVTIRYNNHQEAVFRIDTQATNDAYGHQSFKTPEQDTLDQREIAAITTLAAAGLRRDYAVTKLPLETLEALAEVVKVDLMARALGMEES